MTLVLKLEHAPHPQPRSSVSLERGDLAVGRGADADWQLDDPDMFVSRRHCVFSGSDGEYTLTDASRGGVFVDGSDQPLGPGNSVRVEQGMRIRIGDFVLRADVEGATTGPESQRPQTAAPRTDRAQPAPRGFETDDFFSAPRDAPPKVERPKTLPDPFDAPRGSDFFGTPDPKPETDRAAPPLFDDPFTLDPLPSAQPQRPPQPSRDSGFGSFFDDAAPQPRQPDPVPAQPPQPTPPPPPPTPASPPAPAPDDTAADTALRAAFYRGLGLDPARATDDPVAEMEALGARFRLMVEGMQHLLRARAREKQDARVSQTVIGQADVNPLKFMVTTDEALVSLIEGRGRGYLNPEAAITAAFRDLAEHNVKSWTGVQAALRRMIDRFDPEVLEAEMQDVGLLEMLAAGGRSARLWQLYCDRYKRIAEAAEERFLGEAGEDFRDAYEGRKGGNGHD